MQYPNTHHWKGQELRVELRLMPRRLWLGASLDVYAGTDKALATGGRLALAGRETGSFKGADGIMHAITADWQAVLQRGPPRVRYWLSVDGKPVGEGVAQAANWYMTVCVPLALVMLLVWWAYLRISPAFLSTADRLKDF